jgi:hypothetical protein
MTVVSGQVRGHAGQPTPGVYVSAVPVGGRRFTVVPSTYTDLSGRWALDLAPGRWHIRESAVGGFDLSVGDAPVSTVAGESVQATQTAPEPTREDIARLMERRRAARASVTRNEDDELPVTDDVAAMLRERRGE